MLCREGQRYVDVLAPGATLDARPVPPDAQWRGTLRLEGPHQRRNAAVALGGADGAARHLAPRRRARWSAGFADARSLPGRLDRRGKWLFDVAHNPDGMRTLVTALAALRPRAPIHALVAILGDKDWPEMLVLLDGTVERGVLTVAPTAAGRGWNLEALDRWLGDRSPAAGRGTVDARPRTGPGAGAGRRRERAPCS